MASASYMLWACGLFVTLVIFVFLARWLGFSTLAGLSSLYGRANEQWSHPRIQRMPRKPDGSADEERAIWTVWADNDQSPNWLSVARKSFEEITGGGRKDARQNLFSAE